MKKYGSLSVCILALAGLIAGSVAWATATTFSHKKHLDAELDCTACHSQVEESRKAADSNVPTAEACAACHEPSPDVKRQASLDREIVFSHRIHVGKGYACKTCHHVAGIEVEARMQLPKMDVCLSCHKKEKQTEACTDCHTKLGSPELIPKSHTKQWTFAHGEDARQDENYCANCHSQSFCQDCHQGDNISPRPHRRNWTYTHSIAARSGTLECADCHEAANESECVSCHKSPMGKPSSHKRAPWIKKHMQEGEANLAACATCHFDMGEDALCRKCHEE